MRRQKEEERRDIIMNERYEKNDLSDRLFHFAVKCMKYLRTLPNDTEYKIIKP